jgi:PAS domain S-box-containing protein
MPLSGVLIELARAMDQARSLDDVYRAALQGVIAVTNSPRAAILLFDGDGVMRFTAWAGLSADYRAAVEGHSPWTAGEPAPDPVVVPDVSADTALSRFADAFSREDIRSLAFVPIISGGGVIGKFMLYRETVGRFEQSEIQDALAIACQIGLAVERSRREREQVEAHQRLRFALDAAQMGTWDWDLASNRVIWSDNLERVHGLPDGSFDGGFASYQREIHPDDRERVNASLQHAVTAGQPHDVEYRIVAPDGTVRWVHGKGRVKVDANGIASGMTGVCMDISSRKTAEAHIRRALEDEAVVRARLTELTTGAQQLLLSVDRATVMEAVLDLAERVMPAAGYAVWRLEDEIWRIVASRGLSAAFAASTLPRQTHVPFDVPIVAEQVTEEPVLEPRQANYALEHIKSLLSVPLIMRGESAGSVAFYYRQRHRPTDIELQVATALGQLAAAAISNVTLYEEQQRLRRDAEYAGIRAAFLAEASAVLSSLDYERNLQRVAELAVPRLSDWCAVDMLNGDRIERLAVAHSDAAGRANASELYARFPPSLEARGVGLVIRSGRPQLHSDITEEMLLASGRDPEFVRLAVQLRLQSVMLVPLTAGRRTFGAITFASTRDGRRFTAADLEFAMELARRAALAIENARLFQEAREANRLKDEFLATLSHELRTPLNVIVGRVKRLRDDPAGPDVARTAETIDRNAQALTRLVEDLLDVSRFTQGQVQLQLQPLDWRQIVQNVVTSLEPTARAKGVRLSASLGTEAMLVLGDATRLQQVAWNLVTNAIKYTSQDGQIVVSLGLQEGQFAMAVADTGIGISPSFLPHVFDPFRQEESSPARHRGGLGLGLSIVKRMVELHGGRVSVASDGPGRGARFDVRLPCAQNIEPAGAGPEPFAV